MSILKDIKFFQQGGLDTDSAIEYVAKNDYIAAYNIRVTGTKSGEGGYVSNIESNTPVQPIISASAGFNKAIGFQGFETIRTAIGMVANTAGFNEILSLDYDTNIQSRIYTDQISSASGLNLLGLDPTDYVQLKLIDDTYLLWTDGKNEVGYTNLQTLTSGGYGQVLQEDLTLIKPQNLIPITGVYISDTGRAANFLKNKLFQATSQYINADFNSSAWGTWSKRIIPIEESTPTIGADVTQNNGIIWSVNIGSIRTATLNIAVRYGTFDYNIIKTVTRDYIIALPNIYPDVTNEIYEGYNPNTNQYSFVFYGTELQIPVGATETDLLYDDIWPATAIEKINNNIIALGDLMVGYPRPAIDVALQAVGYDPNLSVPVTPNPDPFRNSYLFPGSSGSGEDDHKRLVQANFLGIPNAGDIVTITLYDIRNPSTTIVCPYTVVSGDTLLTAIQHLSETIPSSSYRQDTASPQVILNIVTPPYYGLQSAHVTLFNAGATVSESIHGILDNSSYQLALLHYDAFGRAFPVDTDNAFVVPTQSFAQLNGLVNRIAYTINSAPPIGAVSAQWAITKNNTVVQGALLDVLGNLLAYKGAWDAATNTSPPLAANSGTVGDTYQISAPNGTPTFNLGNGIVQYNSGDYVVYNGISWDIIPKSFGDLTNAGNIMAIKINPLNLFNQLYTNDGVNTVLGYDFTQGDRCTLHYYISGTVTNYINQPCIDVDVYGYDNSTFLVKIEKSAALTYTGGNVQYNGTNINGDNILLRLYTPSTQQAGSETTTDNTTIFYEIGEQIPIANGAYSTTQGFITDGDVYIKTRQYSGAVDPNTAYPIIATDFNFSDFYPSEFTSYGRPRSYYDQLEETEQKASIITSQPYVLGSKVNGLNRFYPADIYGDSNGQTSSSYGSIQILWQRNDVLVVIQELKVGYIPVNIAYVQLNAMITEEAISETLLNNIRYNTSGNIGIGKAKESFDFYNNNGFFVDPNRSEPVRVGLDGVTPISGKMSKYFKNTLQAAYANGYKMIGYYDTFNNEYVLSIQLPGNQLVNIPFNSTYWNVFDSYNITPSEVIMVNSGAHSSASYDTITGIATYIPASGYIGNDSATFIFTTGSGNITKNNCLNWVAGDTIVNQFSFAPAYNQPLSVEAKSNTISVFGNNIPVPISITGGQYSINGGAFTSSSGTVNPNDSVQVEVLTSASNNMMTSCTLTIYTTSATFTATTSFPSSNVGVLVVDLFTDTTLNVSGYCNTPAVADFYQQLVYTGQNFAPSPTTPAANCWALASDEHPPQPTKRFEFNVSKILNAYPLLTSIEFIISGRNDGTLTTVSGSYVQQSGGSSMTMSGSPGGYLPSVTGTELSSTPYSGKAIVGGADGTYGLGVGAVILTFTYNVSANTITLT